MSGPIQLLHAWLHYKNPWHYHCGNVNGKKLFSRACVYTYGGVWKLHVDAVTTIQPPPRFAICRTATLVPLTTPNTSTLKRCSSHSSNIYQSKQLSAFLFFEVREYQTTERILYYKYLRRPHSESQSWISLVLMPIFSMSPPSSLHRHHRTPFRQFERAQCYPHTSPRQHTCKQPPFFQPYTTALSAQRKTQILWPLLLFVQRINECLSIGNVANDNQSAVIT